ncbi:MULTISPECIES: TetR/AcrR family transcriptional regulator [Jeotgalicoccus]|jgi:Transcriptional regulator|uniref:TetR/AcrR family transcriptional regulator n=1 Tax=Jeotgalicoccus nanhaiensis TaxID=568603 RepID=A0ABR9XY67_9STAP|nr:TetR/AcrR family transcriptional regulator [Jeotgalicoccus nanhaiensis]MBF0753731.1 TetR/AcrR family transcriptional regulator [Jeotgalicoccus nanhaiensis]TFU61895.1 TetR/AcrR family transcriptional regulator [Jeotgalicoccus nanhaiensis]
MSQKEITKNNLIEAFWDIYKEKPLSKITVKEITDKAGYNRGTFYTYFKDINEIQQLLKENLIPTKDMILGPLMMLDKNSGNIFETLDRTNDYVKEHSEKIAVLIGPEGDPSFVHEFKMRIRMIIMDYVYELKVKEPEKIEYIIEYQLSALIGMFQLWLEKNESMDENVLADFVEEVSNQGVTTIMTSMLNNKN